MPRAIKKKETGMARFIVIPKDAEINVEYQKGPSEKDIGNRVIKISFSKFVTDILVNHPQVSLEDNSEKFDEVCDLLEDKKAGDIVELDNEQWEVLKKIATSLQWREGDVRKRRLLKFIIAIQKAPNKKPEVAPAANGESKPEDGAPESSPSA